MDIDRFCCLRQTLKDAFGIFRRDAISGIRHREAEEICRVVQLPGAKRNGALGRGKLDPIVNEVGEHLSNAHGIDEHRRELARKMRAQRNVSFGGRRLQCVEDVGDHWGQREPLGVHGEFPGVGTRAVQQITDHGPELIDVAQHDVEMLTLLGIQLSAQAIEKNGDKLINRRQRGSELMRNVGEKPVLNLQFALFFLNINPLKQSQIHQ